MQTVINLSIKDNILKGKYSPVHDDILVVLDTRLSMSYTVTLPDLTTPENKEFMFKNISYGNTGASVTLQTVNNQFIDGQYFGYVINPGDFISLRTNRKDTWVLLGANETAQIQDTIYLGINGLKYWKIHVDSVGALNIDYDTLKGVGVLAPVWSSGYIKYDGKGLYV